MHIVHLYRCILTDRAGFVNHFLGNQQGKISPLHIAVSFACQICFPSAETGAVRFFVRFCRFIGLLIGIWGKRKSLENLVFSRLSTMVEISGIEPLTS